MQIKNHPSAHLPIQTWAQKEASRILHEHAEKDFIIIETGYGPSALPHLGTATEVIRSMMVAKVLRTITHKAIIVTSFIDDMDGLRKIPPNLPNQEMLLSKIGVPLFQIPDPYGKFSSFSEMASYHLNEFFKKLGYSIHHYKSENGKIELSKLNPDGADIVIIKSHEAYSSGAFDEIMLKILHSHQKVLDVILPTLGDERRKTYSPFLPISPRTGKVLETNVIRYLPEKDAVLIEEDGERYEVLVTGGHCKPQWKVDFLCHWMGCDVCYELVGKDIGIGSVPITSELCKIFGHKPPLTLMYEMFLDAEGKKISKSKGNGVSVEEFLRYLTIPGVKHFMFNYPKSAKRIDIVKMPTYLDLFLKDLEAYHINPKSQMENPIWYINIKNLPPSKISASMALGMAQGFQLKDLPLFIQSLEQEAPLNETEKMVVEAMYHFYHEQYAKPIKITPPEWLKPYMQKILPLIEGSEEEIRHGIYELGNSAVKAGHVASLKEWFKLLYNCIFGTDTGPRLDAFFCRYGKEGSANLLLKLIA